MRIIISILVPFFLLIFFASLLTTKPYLQLSKGLYESHSDVYFDHDYAIERIAGYLNYRYDNLDFGINEFDSDIILRDTEISHMVDVKNLYTTLKISATISLIIAISLSYLMYKKDYNELYKTFKNIYFGPMFFVMFLGVSFVVNFDRAFTVFHQLFFTNDDWILYSTDVLIILLPQMFWLVSGVIILVLFSISLGVIYYINEKIHYLSIKTQ